MRGYSKHKTLLRIVGIPLIVIGAILLIMGFVGFYSMNIDVSDLKQNINRGANDITKISIGGLLIIVGSFLVGMTVLRPLSKYYSTEVYPGTKITGRAFAEGMQEAGFRKEIVKIRCPHCGYLESEDAKFCSKCGKKL